MASDVSALVTTIGEKTLPESLAALEAQTLALADIVVVRDVHPFTAAINEGLRRVKTPFFVQCDADMILDPDCVETLRRFATDGTGVSIGYLDDALLGTIQAVKLFRTSVLERAAFRDTVASDSDRILRMKEDGDRIAFARRPTPLHGHAADVLGEHRPNYDDALYVYGKFKLMAATVRKRESWPEFRGVLRALKRSTHPMADFALVAFCHGLFSAQDKCGHRPFEQSPDQRFLREFTKQEGGWNRLFAITKLEGFEAASELARFYEEDESGRVPGRRAR